MKTTIIAAGAVSALLFGAVAIAQTTGSTDTTGATAGATTGAATDTGTTADNMPADGSQTSGATNASEYGDDASGTAMDAAGERG